MGLLASAIWQFLLQWLFGEAVDLINSNPFANGTSIYTNSGAAGREFAHRIEVGMVGINVPIPVPMAFYSFGGWKNSLFGDTAVHSAEGIHFYTRLTSTTIFKVLGIYHPLRHTHHNQLATIMLLHV